MSVLFDIFICYLYALVPVVIVWFWGIRHPKKDITLAFGLALGGNVLVFILEVLWFYYWWIATIALLLAWLSWILYGMWYFRKEREPTEGILGRLVKLWKGWTDDIGYFGIMVIALTAGIALYALGWIFISNSTDSHSDTIELDASRWQCTKSHERQVPEHWCGVKIHYRCGGYTEDVCTQYTRK